MVATKIPHNPANVSQVSGLEDFKHNRFHSQSILISLNDTNCSTENMIPYLEVGMIVYNAVVSTSKKIEHFDSQFAVTAYKAQNAEILCRFFVSLTQQLTKFSYSLLAAETLLITITDAIVN